MSNDRAVGIEERIPASECENDSSPAKHSKRVSWNIVVETDDFVSQGRDTTHCYSSDPSEEGCPRTPEPPFETTAEKSSILKPATETPFPTIETILIETKICDRYETPSLSNTASNTPNDNAATQDSCTTSMDPQNPYLPKNRVAAVHLTPNDAEQSAIIHQDLLWRVSRLKQAILSRRKLDSTQKGKSLVKEYELKTELEALCEDVLFLGDKKGRLAETLRGLRAKKAELLRHSNDGDESEEKEDGGLYQTTPTVKGTGVSDACVQTDDWLTGSGV
jgi:hypothetical protein